MMDEKKKKGSDVEGGPEGNNKEEYKQETDTTPNMNKTTKSSGVRKRRVA